MSGFPRPRVTLVVGARPNFMKAAALLPALRAEGFAVRLVHTGQHYDRGMSEDFLGELGLPRPQSRLSVRPGAPARQTAEMLLGLDRDLAAHPPRAVVVVGDVTSTLAGALAATRRGILLAHVEAGMRSFDRRMPEEVNRVVTDHLADLCFTTTAEEDRNLRREGIPRARIVRTGDVVADLLLRTRTAARARARRALRRLGLRPRAYGMATLHRAGNVDDPRHLRRLLEGLRRCARLAPVLFPVHPRTRLCLGRRGLPQGVRAFPPLGYLAFTGLLGEAAVAITDSGSVQLEAALLGVPCLTVRDTTERRFTCRLGANHLVGHDPAELARWFGRLLAMPRRRARMPGCDGRASERIASALLRRLRLGRRPG